MRNRGFSDKLYFLNLALSWLFIHECIAVQLIAIFNGTTDVPLIIYGIPAVFAELGIHTGFIVHKARIENLAKHKKLKDASVSIDM